MGDIIKDSYFALEDRYYSAMDWLDTHGLPVYKVIDPIDKIIPSFALFGIIFLLLVLGIVFSFTGFGGIFSGSDASVAFRIVGTDGNPLPNVGMQFTYLGNTQTLTSNAQGIISFSVPKGTKINYQLSDPKYELVKSSITPTDTTTKTIELKLAGSDVTSKTIKLVNTLGQPIVKDAHLTFTCGTAYGVPPSAVDGSGGTYVVTPNADCDPLIVSVRVDGYDAVDSYRLIRDVQSIQLIETQTIDAHIDVTVQDTSNAPVPNMSVSVQKDGIEVTQGITDNGGHAVLDVAAGEFTVVSSDPNGIYVSAQDTITAVSQQTSHLTLTMNRNAAGSIQVQVTDKSSGNPLVGAVVKIKNGSTILNTLTVPDSSTTGTITIPIPDKTITYLVSVNKDGYLGQQKAIPGNTTSTTLFAMEKFNGRNGAKLKVRIVDQDGDPVTDAQVVLYDGDTGFLSAYDGRVTDSNGVATFNNVISGNYQAFAYKATLTGKSTKQFFDISDPDTQTFDIKMEIPNGDVQVHVVDKDGNPVGFARVTVINAFNGKILGADLTDTNGTYILPQNQQKAKADKDVFLRIEKANFATLTTAAQPIIPDATQSFEETLFPAKLNGNIEISLVGLYIGDKSANGVSRNKDYTAKFRVTIPQDQTDLDSLEAHVRTGEKDIVEKDDWYINSVNFPRASIVKGGSWDPNNGLDLDNASITNGPAKWFNAELDSPEPGMYEFEAQLHVKDTATPQELLKLFYKVRTDGTEISRDPTDANPSQELYANTKLDTFPVGVTSLCDAQFCFDSSVLDVKDQIIEDVQDTFSATIAKDYKMQFTLQNNGSAFYNNANLRIKASNDLLQFQSYEIFSAENLRLTGIVNDNEIKNPLNVGNLTPQKKIVGSLNFRAAESGTSVVTIELVSDFKVVFSKTISVTAAAQNNFDVTVQPDFYPSNIPIDLQLQVKDQATQNEVADALVKLTTQTGVVLATKMTDAAGNASITLPGQFPGKKIKLSVEKGEYNSFVKELAISDQILTFNPNPVGINMNVKTEHEKTTTITFTNSTNLPLIIRKIEVQGNLLGYLDREKINSGLQAYVGKTVPAQGSLDVVLRSVLTEEGIALNEHQNIDAVLAVTAENYGWPWSFDLPLTYSLGVSSEVDDPTCFRAVPNTWKSSTDGKTITYEFQIQNNCAIKGNPSALQKLEAQAKWNGNETGELLLSVFRSDKPNAIGAAKVRGGYFSGFLPSIAPQDTLTARLDFTPYGGVKGQSKVDILLQATNPLEGKPQLLNSTIAADLTVSNLADCIIFDKEVLDMTPDKGDSFTIETKGCGNPVDFTLDSDLDLSLKTFTLQGDDKKEVKVLATNLDLGQYPITVNTKGNTEKIKSQQQIIKARIHDPNACLQLNRYEFDVFDDPNNQLDGVDTARLENLCAEQNVPVIVVVPKSFWDSLKTGLLVGAGSALITALTDNGKKDDKKTTTTTTTTNTATNPLPSSSTNNNQGNGSGGSGPPVLGDPKHIDQSGIAAPAQSSPITGLTTLLQGAGGAANNAGLQGQGSNLSQRTQQEQLAAQQAEIDRLKAQQSGGASSGIGGLFGGISNLVSLGTGNPLVSFGVGTAVGTLLDWLLSSDKEFNATVKGYDVRIDKIFMSPVVSDPTLSIEDTDIEVKQSGAALVPKIPASKPVVGKVEGTNLVFTNKSQFVDKTIYRSLVIEGKRYNYKQGDKYTAEIPDKNKLKIDTLDDARVKFHLQFDAIAPDKLGTIVQPPIALSCDTFSEKTGKTGINASPKIAFSWNFTDIPDNACDVGRVDTQGNPTHIYCDAAQFSIELVKKTQELRQFIEANAPFKCPVQDQLSGYKTQPIVAADIGISSIGVDNISTTDVNVQVGIENKTPVDNHAQLNITYNLIGGTGNGTTVQQNVLVPVGGSKITVGFRLSNLPVGHYDITATLVPETCVNCFNSVTASDSINTQFSVNANGTLAACEPYSTTRLDQFIRASTSGAGSGTGTGGGSGTSTLTYPAGLDKDKVLGLVHFKAHLQPDRFTNDFFSDFDRFAQKYSFFDAPTYYLNDVDGLHRYFTDRERWTLSREGSPIDALGYKVPSPGIYDVTIDINFDEPEMRFFKNGVPNAHINVYLEKSSSTDDEISPFYSLPFDGLIGTDDGQGRVGYGVNYSGEVVNLTSDAANQVSSVDITNSTPVSTLSVNKTESFKTLNSTERGDVLTVEKNGSNDFTLKWAPSYATPVLMTVTSNNIKGTAYGYYSVGVNNDTSQSYIGAQGNPWYGVGAACRDFEDNVVIDAFDRRYDTSAINADCGLVGPQKNIAYGFEWCNEQNNIHKGNVTLKSIFYTPQGSLSSMSSVAANDAINIQGEGLGGNTIPLNGSSVIANNAPGSDLKSVQQILDMVAQQQICVRNSGSKTEFFWNPKEVFNAIVQKEKAAEAACIKG